MGRKKKKLAPAEPVAGLGAVERSAFDEVDPEHVPERKEVAPPPRPVERAKRPRRLRSLEETERRIHGTWMVLLGPAMFFFMRMLGGQNVEAQKKLDRVRTTFVRTTCTIEGIQTMSGEKTGRRANYEYSWIVDGKGYRGFGYAPDGPRRGVSDEQLRNAYPLRSQVPCLYDPSARGTAYLTSSPVSTPFDPTFLLWLGAGMTLVGVAILLHDPVRARLR